MSSRRTALSLQLAKVASAALESSAAIRRAHPEVSVPFDLGMRILNGCVVILSAKPRRAPRRPVQPKKNAKVYKLPIRRRKAPAPEEARSAWEPSSPQTALQCKALLLEVLRRAAHDWVLYRGHTEIHKRECANDAYVWLFKENSDHASWKQRATAVFDLGDVEAQGVRTITSFLGICEALDLDPDTVRAHVKTMTIQAVISAGRPAETRKVKRNELPALNEASLTIGVDIDSMPRGYEYDTLYETYGSVATPDMLSLNDVYGIY